MVVQISQATMDLLTTQHDKFQAKITTETNKINADTAQRDNDVRQLSDLTALINDSVVVP